MIEGEIRCHKISAQVGDAEIEQMEAFLQNAVNCWCKNQVTPDGKQKEFNAKCFLGQENSSWLGTPFEKLKTWHEAYPDGKNTAYEAAGFDVGHLLFNVLFTDERTFQRTKQNPSAYLWTGR